MINRFDTVIYGDCYKGNVPVLDMLSAQSVDLICSDFPYNRTAAAWDLEPLNLAELWPKLKRVLKPGGAVITTASQPFTTDLINSNRAWFKYCLVWDKKFAGNFNNAKYMPMITHEDICIFSERKTIYNPQLILRDKPIRGGGFTASKSIKQKTLVALRKEYTEKQPVSILHFPRALGRSVHATQKPVELYEWLIKTYSNPGDIILDPFAGSGTTGEAAFNTGRRYILIEKMASNVLIARERLNNARSQLTLIG